MRLTKGNGDMFKAGDLRRAGTAPAIVRRLLAAAASVLKRKRYGNF